MFAVYAEITIMQTATEATLTAGDLSGSERSTSGGVLRWAVRLFVLFVLLAIGGVVTVIVMGNMTPKHWRAVDANDPKVYATAQHVEKSTASELTQVRPNADTWELRFTLDQINAWASTRLPRWLDNQQVPQEFRGDVKQVSIAYEDNRFIVGAKLDQLGEDRVISAYFDTKQADDGTLEVQLAGLTAGVLPLPLGPILDQLKGFAPDGLSGASERDRVVNRAINEGTVKLTLPLADGRRVRVIDAKLDANDTVVFTCQTERDPAVTEDTAPSSLPDSSS